MRDFKSELNQISSLRFKYQNENFQSGDLYNSTQRRAEEIFRKITGFRTIPANAHGPSCLDGFLVNNGQLRAGYEIKCRNSTFVELEKFGDFLLTQDKVSRCTETCKNLCIPFIAICYSIPDDDIRFWLVSNDYGRSVQIWKYSENFSYGGKIVNVYHFPHSESYRNNTEII
jgi:hypothetical protein